MYLPSSKTSRFQAEQCVYTFKRIETIKRGLEFRIDFTDINWIKEAIDEKKKIEKRENQYSALGNGKCVLPSWYQ